MDTEVRHNEDRQRYELVLGDQVIGIADYQPRDGVLVFPHTEISPQLQGRGFGEQLVRAALDDVRRRGHKIRPQCWFVREFIDDHPDYADLAA